MIALFAYMGLTSLLLAVIYAISWIGTCGLFKLVTLCFGWNYSWGIATGIWILFLVAKSIFSHKTTVKK